jgi:signal transduction histidine kinase
VAYDLYYLTPLRIENKQVGVMQIYYYLTGENQFYNRIRQTLVVIGSSIFFLSFILAYFYFRFFANGIIRLGQMVDRIREGHFKIESLGRRDEIGRLSTGIQAMSNQIMYTMKGMEEEQEKLKLAVNKLSLLDQQQKQFIGNVTHEFKTPLTSIKAYIDLIEMYPDDNKLIDKPIMTIKNETIRLYEMVDKVLQLSMLEKYDFEYNPVNVETKQLILSVLQRLSGKINKFSIILETELTEASVKADKDSLVIILMNLLDNAIKYNKTNGKIFVRNYISNKHVYIEITDTGIGIPKEAVSRVFDPFYTVDKNRSRESGGTGLGLSLVKKYTEKQGGSVTLINTDSKGTTFQISFPEYKA